MARKATAVVENCALCGCAVNRSGRYATEDREGRAHATEHHYVAERFFGRSNNRKGTQRTPVFPTCPWGLEGRSDVYCYECHELVLHNPVLLPEDVAAFGRLVRERALDEQVKVDSLQKLAGRIELFHEVIAAGLRAVDGVQAARETIVRDEGAALGPEARERLAKCLVRVVHDDARNGMGVRISRDHVAIPCHCLPPGRDGRPILPEPRGPEADRPLVEVTDLSGELRARMVVCAADPCSDFVLLERDSDDDTEHQPFFREVHVARLGLSPTALNSRAVTFLTHAGQWMEGRATGICISLHDPTRRVEGGTSGSAVFDSLGKVVGLIVTESDSAPLPMMCLLADALPGRILNLIASDENGA